jgi:hypothetical protein
MKTLALLCTLSGCYAAEAALSRQGQTSGTAASGGIGVAATASLYREDGVQNLSAGMSFDTLQLAPEGDVSVAIGAGARYARQLTTSPRWRGHARVAAGLAPCDLKDCGAREMEAASAQMFSAALGVERFLIAPDLADPANSGFISATLGVVYTRANHEELGFGDFIGVELGLRAGLNLFARRAGAEP